MSQIVTKFIKDLAILSGSSAAHGKIGSGAATATQALFSDGAGGTSFRSILSTDIPTLNQNTTGTASNITATSNSTLTTLSALTTANSLTSATSLAISGSQVSGDTFGAVNGSALTNLSAAALSGVLPVGVTGGSGLSIATSQLTGTVSLTTQVSGILPVANGGTNASTAAAAFNNLSPMTTTGDMIYEASASTAARLPIGTTGQVLTVVGGIPTWSATSATMTPGKDTVVLSSTDITNQFITLSHTPIANSTDLLIQGAGDQLEGASYDYTVSGATIVFQNGLATGGASALVAGDILQVAYMY